jgi:hypothetical protein
LTERDDPRISAEVVLKAKSGKRLDRAGGITSRTVADYAASPETIARAKEILGRHGFSVDAIGPTLTISGPKELFEQVFQTQIRTTTDPHTQAKTVASHEPVTIPEMLKGVIENIIFPEPPEFF